jgi:hypothetical protein
VQKSGSAGRETRSGRGLGQEGVAVKRRNQARDLTVIAIVAAASVIVSISTDNSFFAPIFATEALTAVYLAIWIGSVRS